MMNIKRYHCWCFIHVITCRLDLQWAFTQEVFTKRTWLSLLKHLVVKLSRPGLGRRVERFLTAFLSVTHVIFPNTVLLMLSWVKNIRRTCMCLKNGKFKATEFVRTSEALTDRWSVLRSSFTVSRKKQHAQDLHHNLRSTFPFCHAS